MATTYRVNWDNGASACGTFPDVFDSYEDAEVYGNEWADECNLRDFGTTEPEGDCYTFDVIEEETGGVNWDNGAGGCNSDPTNRSNHT